MKARSIGVCAASLLRELYLVGVLLTLLLSAPLAYASVIGQQLDTSASEIPGLFLPSPGSDVLYQPNVITTGASAVPVRQVAIWIKTTNPNSGWSHSYVGQDCSNVAGNADSYLGFATPGNNATNMLSLG